MATRKLRVTAWALNKEPKSDTLILNFSRPISSLEAAGIVQIIERETRHAAS